MKNQNVKNKLTFNKAAIVELNDNQLNEVNGGSLITSLISISIATITLL